MHCHKLKWDVSTGYKQALFSSGDKQVIEEVTQTGCACSVLEGFTDMTEQSPEQPDLAQSRLCFQKDVGL